MTRRIAALSTFLLLALPAVALAAEENGPDEEKFNPASEWTLHEWIPIHLGPIDMEEQVVAIYAGIHGFLDRVPVGQVPRFQEELRETLRAEGSIYGAIRETGDLADETAAKLEEALKRFQESFNVEEERGLVG